MNQKLKKIKEFAEKYLTGDNCSAHGMDHVVRVYNLATKLAQGQDVDLDVLQAAALLHDIGGRLEQDNKNKDLAKKKDHAVESARIAKPFLKELGYSDQKIKHICDCIISHRFRTDNKPKTLEAKIVFDADKLETVGAIGIARAFTWVGRNNAHIYKKVADINKYAQENLGGKLNGKIQDRTKHSPQINWETKDKYILEYLYTPQAKEFAKKRKEFFKEFMDKLEREIEGKE